MNELEWVRISLLLLSSAFILHMIFFHKAGIPCYVVSRA